MDPQLTNSPDSAQLTDNNQIIRHGFQVGSYALLVAEQTRAEVIKVPSICVIPDTPDWFAGFINHRGETVPVYDLDRYLQVVDEPKERRQWVVLLDEHPNSVGILTSEPPQSVLNPTELDQEIGDLPAVFQKSVSKIYEQQGQQWLVIDHRKLFLALKQQF